MTPTAEHSLPYPLVVFVDDEPQLLAGFSDTLRREPYEVVTVTSATAALDVLKRRPVNVLVTDERMPNMSGAELLKRVRHEYPHVVCIMLTGQASLAVSMAVINDGLYRLLGKPVPADELRRVVRDALKIQTLKRRNG